MNPFKIYPSPDQDGDMPCDHWKPHGCGPECCVGSCCHPEYDEQDMSWHSDRNKTLPQCNGPMAVCPGNSAGPWKACTLYKCTKHKKEENVIRCKSPEIWYIECPNCHEEALHLPDYKGIGSWQDGILICAKSHKRVDTIMAPLYTKSYMPHCPYCNERVELHEVSKRRATIGELMGYFQRLSLIVKSSQSLVAAMELLKEYRNWGHLKQESFNEMQALIANFEQSMRKQLMALQGMDLPDGLDL